VYDADEMMRILSAVFYFLAYHPGLAIPVIILFFVLAGVVLAQWTKQKGGYILGVVGLIVGPFNSLTGPFCNSLFLNAVGVEGTGIIVHKTQTDIMLNYQYVWAYDVVLKAQDGRETATTFTTNDACIYPIRNEILIPPQGQSFVIKYVPGFERNFVIMSDESQYGKQRLIEQDFQPVEKAHAQLEVSPNNPAFIGEYRKAVQTFLAAHRNDADPEVVRDLEGTLDELGSSNGK
jgi:hypothetical protein